MKTHWIGIIKWNDGTILRTEPFYKYDQGIKVWSSKFSFENTGKFEWIDYERVEEPKQIKCYCGHTTYCDCGPLEEPKQETTAKEFYDEHYSDDAVVIMRDYAKLHVEAALKAASDIKKNYRSTFLMTQDILNAYPIENIK